MPKSTIAKVKFNLSRQIPIQIDQGNNVVMMSTEVMSATEPLIVTLKASNTDLEAKIANLLAARGALKQAKSELTVSASAQRTSYNNLGNFVQTSSDGQETFIISCGYGVRADGSPKPPVEDAPDKLSTRVNGVPGVINLSWGKVQYARNYEVQTTTDLSGATGWTSQTAMPSAAKLDITGLVTGTKYALRVRAWGNGMPGPFSSLCQQMAP